ncbi:MAG: hypothetical protein ACJ8GN_09915 [Longimicrobiaceae bacterium]
MSCGLTQRRRDTERRRVRPLFVFPAALLLAGCMPAAVAGGSPAPAPADDGRAIVGPRCGHGDAYGPTFLTVPTSSGEYPQLLIVTFDDRVENTTATLPARGDDQYPIGEWCTTEFNCRALTSATVVFGPRRPDRSIAVTIDALLPDGTRFTTTRVAQPRPKPTEECG